MRGFAGAPSDSANRSAASGATDRSRIKATQAAAFAPISFVVQTLLGEAIRSALEPATNNRGAINKAHPHNPGAASGLARRATRIAAGTRSAPVTTNLKRKGSVPRASPISGRQPNCQKNMAADNARPHAIASATFWAIGVPNDAASATNAVIKFSVFTTRSFDRSWPSSSGHDVRRRARRPRSCLVGERHPGSNRHRWRSSARFLVAAVLTDQADEGRRVDPFADQVVFQALRLQGHPSPTRGEYGPAVLGGAARR